MPVFLGFPDASAGKESACNVGDLGLIPGLGRSPGEEKGCPLQDSGLENCMDRSELDSTQRLSLAHGSVCVRIVNILMYCLVVFMLCETFFRNIAGIVLCIPRCTVNHLPGKKIPFVRGTCQFL